ncbi:MAG: DUF6045 family protein [Clostridiales bacterium]|nr:DUF6045 family protein [Clostridiales bacterium]
MDISLPELMGDLLAWLGEMINSIIRTLAEEVSSKILDQFLKWIYKAFYDAIAEFFTKMGGLGVEIFDLSWVAATVKLFGLLAWALFVVGLIVSVFDLAIESQSGRASIQGTALNAIKGFMAAGLITTVPIELYKFCITLQNIFARDLSMIMSGEQSLGLGAKSLTVLEGAFNVSYEVNISLFNALAMIALAYCVIKVFFDNIKRGGILIIQIAVGSLHMFSVPRGYTDGFIQWVKQVIALCLTAFLQTSLLYLGLMTFGGGGHMLLGLGIMISASEVPRIAQQFGLETSTKVNITNIMHTATMAVNLTRTVARAAGR